jgi:hypothetical protein
MSTLAMLVNRPNLSGNGAYGWRDQTIVGPGPRGSQLKLEVATLGIRGQLNLCRRTLHVLDIATNIGQGLKIKI